jgi:hypothetical protein
MTKKQECKLKMYLAVSEYLTLNEGLLKSVHHFVDSFSEFRKILNQISLTSTNQRASRKGITTDKKKQRQNLVSIALNTSNILAAYAKFNADLRLFYQVHISKSDLEDMRDVDLKTRVEIIYKESEAYLKYLHDYGFTQDTLRTFREAISAFDEYYSKPRLGIIERHQLTLGLGELMSKAYSILLDIDIEMGIIMYEEPDFYSGYKTARKLVHTRTSKLALRAIVKESGSGKPVKGAIITFIPDGALGDIEVRHHVLVKKSAVKGGFRVYNMKSGTYKMEVRKPGYKDKEVRVIIEDGERCELAVELEKG